MYIIYITSLMHKTLTGQQQQEFIAKLKSRFIEHINRHPKIEWVDIQKRLEENPQKLWSLFRMEETGGEPDVIGFNNNTNEYLFCDCALESPKGRRSICYDREALESRDLNSQPTNTVIDMAEEMGIEVLTEEQYRHLQTLGTFDLKTSSWILTPKEIRNLGGALFCDRRYNHVFVYHNGAQSYYASRGFRGILKI